MLAGGVADAPYEEEEEVSMGDYAERCLRLRRRVRGSRCRASR